MTTWANRENLKGSTIDAITREIDDINEFGVIKSADVVPYPVTGMDVVYALEYIRDNNLMEKFLALNNGSPESKLQTDIPIPDRTRRGRSTPRIILDFEYRSGSGTNPQLYGSIKSSYEGMHT